MSARRDKGRTGIGAKLDRQRRMADKLARADMTLDLEVAALREKHAMRTARLRRLVEGGWAEIDARMRGKAGSDAGSEVAAKPPMRRRGAPQAAVAAPEMVSAALRTLIALADVGGSASVEEIVGRTAMAKGDVVDALKEAQRVRATLWLPEAAEYCLAYEGSPISTEVGDSRAPREDHLTLGGVLLTAMLGIQGKRLDDIVLRLRREAGVETSKASLSQWRLGQSGPRREAADALEAVLGIPVGSWERPVYDRATGGSPALPLVRREPVEATAPSRFPAEPDVLALMTAIRTASGGRDTVGNLAAATGMDEPRVRLAAKRAVGYGLLRASIGSDERFETVRTVRVPR